MLIRPSLSDRPCGFSTTDFHNATLDHFLTTLSFAVHATLAHFFFENLNNLSTYCGNKNHLIQLVCE